MSEYDCVIIDYGVGNVLSVRRAFESLGAKAIISSDISVIESVGRIILPGVGAFANGMKALNDSGLADLIKVRVDSGVPILGICLGMQLLFGGSEEFGVTQGLELLPGEVKPLAGADFGEVRLKIPHIGWNGLVPHEGSCWDDTVLRSVRPLDEVYFAHSYMVETDDLGIQLAQCLYGKNKVLAVVQRENIVGCQFHPEKSGEIGKQILSDFLCFSG